ncbi:zinc finger CCCH domain-containing protein 53-like [Zingiber officinale]|uniref:zinc finger CCCH domain-containing protein 53-like n=1 Tax=Zingiber officinale TaxID=94328 RepID=UPI001C4D0E0B|nr:zinc finger CCCH domain-containing protein 53-like [Zingiber officinale]
MDAYEATRVVLSRIQSLDPENAHRIMGLILLQEHGEQEMIRLAFAPETLLQSVVLKTLKELGLAPPSIPGTPSGDASPLLLRQNSASRLLAASSPSSWAPPPIFSRSNSGMGGGDGLSPSLDEHQSSDELVSPNNLGLSPFYGGADLIDDFHLADQLSFLGDHGTAPNSSHALSVAANAGRGSDAFNRDIDGRSPIGNGDGAMLPNRIGWGINSYHHCRSSSAADICLGDPASGYGWKPCLYFARGYCKNGSACRFLHGLPEDVAADKMDAAVEQQCQELLQRSKSQRIGDVSHLMASAFPFSPTGSVPPSPSSSSSKCLNFWLQHQQNESQRVATAAAAAAALMLAGDDSHKFIGTSRMERNDLMTNPGSRQIYLTFPADSTFSEEDVSNYFSIFGPVQDVRIPFQQKRMFGFVTFVYPETVKLILAKGNPHFVCDSRVLVKPYKEKGKIPEKFRKQQQQAENLDLQQLVGTRMMLNNGSFNQELLLRRKLEEQQQAAELQRAIELQAMRFMGLRLNLNNISFSSAPASINSPSLTATQPIGSVDSSNNGSNICSSSSQEDSLNEEKSLSVAETEEKSNGDDKNAAAGETNLNEDGDFQESADHNLPDSPFASPAKSLFMLDSLPNNEDGTSVVNTSNNHDHLVASTLLPITSLPDKPSLSSCFLHLPRLPSGHGAIGM